MKKNWTRRASLLAGAVTIGFLATGCSGSPSGQAETGPVTLTVYGWKGSTDTPQNIPEVNAAFEKAYPNITVNYKYYDAGDAIAQKLQPQLLAGDAPDVFMTDPSTMRQYQKNGYLADLTDQSWTKQLVDPIKPFSSVDEKVYGAPLEMIGIGLYANMAILKKAGIDTFPASYPELIANLKTLKSKGLPGLAVPNKGGYTGEAIINGIASTLVYSRNAQWDSDYVAGKTSFNDWTSSIEQFDSLGQQGLVDFKSEVGVDEWGQGTQDFQAGKTAFLYQGAWNAETFTKAQPETQFGPWPGAKSGDQWATLFAGVNWSVNAASKHLDAAKKYAAFWTQESNLTDFLKAEAAFSPYKNVASPTSDTITRESEAFDAGHYRILGADSWFTQTKENDMGADVQALMLGQTKPSALSKKWTSSFKTTS